MAESLTRGVGDVSYSNFSDSMSYSSPAVQPDSKTTSQARSEKGKVQSHFKVIMNKLLPDHRKSKVAIVFLFVAAGVIFSLILRSLPPYGDYVPPSPHNDAITATTAPSDPTFLASTAALAAGTSTTQSVTQMIISNASPTGVGPPPPTTAGLGTHALVNTPASSVGGVGGNAAGSASPGSVFPSVVHISDFSAPAHAANATDTIVGWPSLGQLTPGSSDHMCSISAPAADWSLRTCTSPRLGDQAGRLQIKLLTYNVLWRQREGDVSRLLAEASWDVPFDIMVFQECSSISTLLHNAGLSEDFKVVDSSASQHSISIAYRDAAWQLLEDGLVEVAEDSTFARQKRPLLWARFLHVETGVIVFIANHRGPKPLNSGGICGPTATAFALLEQIGLHAHAGDVKVLAGDFGSGIASPTVRLLSEYMWHAYAGTSFFGVDNVFTTCAAVTTRTNLGSGGGEHDALSLTITTKGR